MNRNQRVVADLAKEFKCRPEEITSYVPTKEAMSKQCGTCRYFQDMVCDIGDGCPVNTTADTHSCGIYLPETLERRLTMADITTEQFWSLSPLVKYAPGRVEKGMRLLFRQPPAVLRPNGRGCWPVRARMVKNVRGQARLVVLSVLRREPERWAGFVPTRYEITWFFWAGLGPDADNVVASCKALLDGCADGFGINDRYLVPGRVDRVKVKRADARAGYVELRFYGTSVPGSDRKEYDE